jgi:two-component system sensor histidine kinase DegS
VRRYVTSFKEKNDIKVELEIAGEERRLESYREVLLFRAIQELMVYSRDVANAKEIKVRLDMSADRIKVLVEDNGRGFDADAVFSGEESPSNDARAQGLMMLKEKYELVEGAVVVDSSESDGTTVRLELPAGKR